MEDLTKPMAATAAVSAAASVTVADSLTDERMKDVAWRMRVREATDLLDWFKREAYKDHTL